MYAQLLICRQVVALWYKLIGSSLVATYSNENLFIFLIAVMCTCNNAVN